MPAVGQLKVRGLRELNRSFDRMGKEMKSRMREELVAVGEPVRELAEQKAVAEITNIGERWSKMRLGTTSKVVYVAPKARRRRGTPRKNLGGLLVGVMQAALEQREPQVVAGFERMLDRIADREGF